MVAPQGGAAGTPETRMKPNPDDYYRSRNTLDTAGAYVILLIVALVALVPLRWPDPEPARTVAQVQQPVAAQESAAAPASTRESEMPAEH